MYKEWVSPPPDAYSDSGYVAYVKSFHDNILSSGSGITHMSGIQGQFDLVYGVRPTLVAARTVSGKPLYYKFESSGNSTVYITVSFDIWSYNNSYIYFIFGNVSLSLTLDNNGIPEKTLLNNSTSSSTRINQYHNTVPYLQGSGTGSNRFTSGKSLLVSNGGTLIIQHCMGMHNGGSDDVQKSGLSIIMNIKGDKLTNVALYNYTYSSVDNGVYYSSSSSYGVGFSQRIAMVMSTSGTTYSLNTVNALTIGTPYMNFFPVSTISPNNDFLSMDGVYYYDQKLIPSEGLVTIGSNSYWLTGKLIEGLSITSSASTVHSFAFKVD